MTRNEKVALGAFAAVFMLVCVVVAAVSVRVSQEDGAQGAGREAAESALYRVTDDTDIGVWDAVTESESETQAETESETQTEAPETEAQTEHFAEVGEMVCEETTSAAQYDGGYHDEAYYIAKTIGVEAPYCSTMEQAAVAWTILNRVDDPRFPSTVAAVVTAPYQFAYFESTPLQDDLYALAIDVLNRWAREKAGEADVGRVLPREYIYYTGDGYHNYFRVVEMQGAPWDWSWENPYDER